MSDSPEPRTNPAEAPLGRLAGRGFFWLMLATGLGKCSALIGQIVLGWLLFAEDWGLYALTLSIAAFVQILRDGGVGHIIIQSGGARYEEMSGPAFWLAFTFNLLAASILLGAAEIATSIYAQPELKPMLWVVAGALVCGTPATIMRAKLQMDMRFAALGWLGAASSVVRWSCAIVLAILDFGPMSFIWAMLATVAFDCISMGIVTGDRPWNRRLSLEIWPSILKKSIWIMVSSIASAFSDRGGYLVLGLLISISLLGQYSFGNELAAQLGALIAFNMQSVLFPTLTRLVGEPRRLARSAERSSAVLFLVTSGAAFLFALLAQPLELLLWHGKWSDAVVAIQVFSIILPFKVMISVPFAVLSAQGRFATQAGVLGVNAAVLMCAAFIAPTFFGENLGAIAATVGISQALWILAISFIFLRAQGCDLRRVALSLLTPWSMACLVGVGIWLLDRAYLGDALPIVRLALICLSYAAIFGLLARVFMAETLRQIMAVAPARIGRIFGAVLCLK